MNVFKRLVFRRMKHAMLLLGSTDKSIGEIANLTDYDPFANFIHAFRMEFGLTPPEWRKQEREAENINPGQINITIVDAAYYLPIRRYTDCYMCYLKILLSNGNFSTETILILVKSE